MGNNMGNCSSNNQYSPALVEKSNNIHSKIHEGSILGLCSYVDVEEEKEKGKGLIHILTCSDDKKLAKFAYNRENKAIQEGAISYSSIHSKSVNKVTASKSFLWSVSRDLTACQYDKNLNVINHFNQDIHTLNIASICVRKDETFMYTGSRDYNIKAFDVETKSCVAAYSQPRNVITCMQLHPNENHMLYQGSEDLQVRIWDTRESSGKHCASTITGYVYFPLCMSVHTSGHFMATGCKGFNSVGCEVKVWDIRSTSKPVAELKSHSQDVTDCKFSDEGDFLFSCSKDGTVCVWDRNQFSGNGVDNGGGGDMAAVAGGGTENPSISPACKYSQNNKIFSNLTVFGNESDSGSSNSKNLNQFAAGSFDGGLSFYQLKTSNGKLGVAEVAYTSPHFQPEVDVEAE